MKLVCTLLLLISSTISFSQDSTETVLPVPNWRLSATYGLNGTQSSFVNWNAGGRNNISLLGTIEASAYYKKDKLKWDTDLGLALGGMQYLGKGEEAGLQKTDDKIDFATNIGCELKSHWYFLFNGDFKSQFLDGFSYPNDSVRVSTFLAPGYSNLSLGFEYQPNEFFSILLSCAAGKLTFVNDEVLANAGAFGVEGAVYDVSTGEVITAGKRFRGEIGAYMKAKYAKDIAKNIHLKTKLELFSNYLEHPENIDVNAEVIFNFKVNPWFSASLNMNVLYDDDIDIRDSKGGFGPRTQFKSVIGLGIAYKMKNFEEESK